MSRLPTTFDEPTYQELADYTARLPIEMPEQVLGQSAANAINNLFASVGDKPRFQTWPEVMVRSGATLPGDVVAGRIPMSLGMRREDYTDIPQEQGPSDTWLGKKLGMKEGAELGPSGELISRAQDLSGMAGGGFASKPNALVAAAESGRTGAPLAALEKAPVFYSAVENAVKNSKTKTASADQWLGEIRNQPGVKQEELDWVLHELPKGPITKSELEQFVKEHKVELKEVNYGSQEAAANRKRQKEILKRLDDIQSEFDARYNEHHGEGRSIHGDPAEFEIRKKLADEETALKHEYNSLYSKDKTKYSQWQLPGAKPESYREMLLTLPKREQPQGITARDLAKQMGDDWDNLGPNGRQGYLNAAERQNNSVNFTSSHWNEPNVLAHVRMNDRVVRDPSGNGGPLNSLHIEEIQSDWHQKGRKEGYKARDFDEKELNRIDQKLMDKGNEAIWGNPDIKDALRMAVEEKVITAKEADTYKRFSQHQQAMSVPDAPFKSNWADLSLKRIIRKAAEEGKDSISWTPGEAQALRYQNEVRRKLNAVEWHNKSMGEINKDGSKSILITPSRGDEIALTVNNKGTIVAGHGELKGKQLDTVLGKDIAKQILEGAEGSIDAKGYVMNSEPMKAYYDKMLVDKANAIVKKFGGKVEQGNLTSGRSKAEIYKDMDANTAEMMKREPDDHSFEAWQRHPELHKRHEELQAEANIAIDGSNKIHILKLTPELKAAALEKGFSLFADTGKVGAPLAALTKVEHNPFTATSFHGSPNPLRGDKIENSGRYKIDGEGPYQVYDKGLSKNISGQFHTKEAAKDWLDKRVGTEFYSTPNPRLAGDYATTNPNAKGPNLTPLRLDTKDYHTVNAMGKTWDAINIDAIREANMLNKKGVVIRNVLDDSDPKNKIRGPQTVYITLDPSTVRSRFAKFDPAKFGESGLLKSDTEVGSALSALAKKWEEKGVRNYVALQSEGAGGNLKLHDLVVPKDKRGQGVGTEFMNDLTKLADETGKKLVLTAAKDYGATSLNRLKDFYKEFGFVENKGRNKDFRISENMYRDPVVKAGGLPVITDKDGNQLDNNLKRLTTVTHRLKLISGNPFATTEK